MRETGNTLACSSLWLLRGGSVAPCETMIVDWLGTTIAGSPDARRGTVMFIHGAPTQSFSYRTVMAQVSFIDLAV